MNRPPSPVLIIGAKSDIGRALARDYAAAGCDIILAARRSAELAPDCEDLKVRHGVEARSVECDVLAADAEGFFDRLGVIPGTVVMVAGLLGDQAESASDDAIAERVMQSNYNGPARLLLAAARRMKSGSIIGISSVAGDRGRASNYIYGSAKAGFTAFLSGLRNSMAKTGVQVITVKPGFVATRMTEGMKLPPRLTAQPAQVSAAILKAQRKGQDILYVKAIWRPIMTIIGAIPERLFKKLSL